MLTQVREVTTASMINEALEFGRLHHDTYKVLPYKGKIPWPTEYGGWLVVPLEFDDSYKPQWAINKVARFKEHFPVVQEIILHEPRVDTLVDTSDSGVDTREVDWQKVGAVAGAFLLAAGAVIGVAGWLVANVIFSVVDPAWIVVLPDGTWLEICAWEEP